MNGSVPAGAGAAPPGTRAALRVAARVWWTATRRRWRGETGVLLLLAGFVGGLAYFSLRLPPGGEALYLTTLFLLGVGVVIVLPTHYLVENVLSSRRWELLPLPLSGLWVARLALGNPLRSLLALALWAWGVVVLTRLGLPPGTLALALLQLTGWTGAAVAVAQMLEELLRRSGSIVLYQVVLIAAASAWMPLLDLLRMPDLFVPGPAWTHGAVRPFLLGTQLAPRVEAAVAAGALALLVASVAAARALLGRLLRLPPPPPPAARLSGALAAAAGRLAPRAPAGFAREVAMLLRFVYVRVDVVLVLLAAGTAFAFGLPFVFAFLPFLWLSVMINLMGPDHVGGAMTRYALAGYPPGRVLRLRHAAILLLTLAAVCVAALAVLPFTGARAPVVGPRTLWMYPLLLAYGLSLVLLLSVLSDRYSLRYPDPIAMRMLFPVRERSAGAGAGLLALGVFLATLAAAIVIFGAWWMLLHALLPGTREWTAMRGVVALCVATHAALYLLGQRGHARARG